MIIKLYFLVILFFSFFILKAQDETRIQEQIAQTTIRLKVKIEGKQYIGTGFFYQFEKNNIKKKFIVTNRHIAENADSTEFTFNRAANGNPLYGDKITYKISKNELKWIGHPDKKIDLSILDLDIIENDAAQKGFPIFIRVISEGLIPNDSIWKTFTYLEDIVMVGYPNGIIDEQNNLPIFRTGVTASQPKLDVNNKPEFITDISTFGGSSGSPIFLRKKKIKLTNPEPNKISWNNTEEFYFIGIHYKSEYFNQALGKNESLSISDLDIESSPKTIKIPLNIGYAIKSSELEKFKLVVF
jgi:hypothetical protein